MGETANGRFGVWAYRRIGLWASGHVFGEATNGTNGTYVRNSLALYLPLHAWRCRPAYSHLSFVICHLSLAERQATPVAGGDVFRRRTRTLTFMDWVPAPLNVPRTGAASLASRPKETAMCCSPHQQLLVGSKATQV
jgi:hypothetical protein